MIRFSWIPHQLDMRSIRRVRVYGLLVLFALLTGGAAFAQQSSVTESTIADRHEITNEKNHHYIGKVELERGDTKIYADEAWFYADEDRFVATGNVVFSQGTNRLASDRVDFNTKTRLGTFHNATGIATLQPPTQQARPGALAIPQVAGQETNVYFFGDLVEKIGPRKYKITNGGFTTCVQPTPRWNLHADTVILNVDHYTVLKQAIFTVKGVPMLYVPVLYYPTKREDRATGFLIPTYGSSTLRGQAIHNAFFWAVDRSEDVTFMHDWFSQVGQGVGSEYRYNFGEGSDGNLRSYMLNQHQSTYAQANGDVSSVPASRSFEVRGGANQLLPGRLRARARVDYFSSIVTMQTFNTNIYDASRNQRSFGGNLVGAWGTYSLNGTFDHSEYFYGANSSSISGSWPRFSLTRNERPIPGTPLYFSVGGEYAHILRDNKSGTSDVDQTLTRLDFSPQVRFPFKQVQWFTVNSTLGWRDTYYSRSLDPRTNLIVEDNLSRRFFTMQAQLLGPIFNRIFDTPENGYADKFKHSIEPYVNISRTSSIDNYSKIVRLEGTDYIVGGVTQYQYGLNNRLYARRRGGPGQPSQAREIFDVEVTQTYYTDQLAAQYDPRYATSFTGAPPNHFSPIALNIRALPANDVNATMRAEFDSRYHKLRTISASGTYSWTGRVQTTAGWTKRAFIKDLAGFNDPRYLDHYVNAATTVHTRDNRIGGIYAFNFDVLRSTMLQQRFSSFYNAQCCGLAFEYQTYNLAGISSAAVPADHRFFLSFTLAGLGNFSPFNGALSGVPR